MDPQQEQALVDVPVLYRPAIKRAFEKTAAPRGVIKAKCLECCGYVRADITSCTATRCPLHAYRPFQ